MASRRSPTIDRLLFGPELASSRSRLRRTATNSTQATASPTSDSIEKSGASAGVDIVSTPTTGSDRSNLHPVVSRWQTMWKGPYATWRPTVLQQRPLFGIVALCVAISCVFASLAVLVVSDGQAVKDWPIQPTVYLAIVTAIANMSLALARLEAVPVSWWYSISRGRSIESLERQWQVSRSLIQAVLQSRHMSLLNIACIAGALAVIDGPFLQRASTVVPAEKISPVTLNVTLMPELPTGFTGTVQYDVVNSPVAELNLLPQYATHTPMEVEYSPKCDGACHTTVHAPGVTIQECSSRAWPITPEMLHSANASWGPWGQEKGDEVVRLPIFYVKVERNYHQKSEAAKVITGVARWQHWQGSYVQKVCFLVPAILEYDVRIESGTVSLESNAASARFVRLANNTHPVNATTLKGYRTLQNDTMDGITEMVELLSQANGTAVFNTVSGQKSWTWDSTTYNLEVFRHQVWPSLGNGSVNFEDPMPTVIENFNQLFFRGATVTSSGRQSKPWRDAAGWIDPGLEVQQIVQAKQVSHENVFRSDLSWYAAAAVIELVTVCLILPMFWGWWTLGCNLSMSPFAVALAFDSSILKDVNSAAGSRGVVEEMGDVRVKFGVVDRPRQNYGSKEVEEPGQSAQHRLGVGRMDEVSAPKRGEEFFE